LWYFICSFPGQILPLRAPLFPAAWKFLLYLTLRGDDRVLYSAPFTFGGGTAGEAEVKATYFGSGTRERGMIENVKVVYRP